MVLTFPAIDLSVYRYIFLAEIFLAEVLVTYTLKKKKYFIFRLLAWSAASLFVVWIFPLKNYDSLHITTFFLSLFSFTLLGMKFCFKEGWNNIIFCGITAYTTQHIAYELFSVICTFTSLDMINVYAPDAVGGEMNVFVVILYGGVYAIVYWFIWAFVAYEIRRQKNLNIKNLSMLALSVVVVLVDVVLNAVLVYSMDQFTSERIVGVAHISNIINCALALWIQYAVLNNRIMHNELETVELLWRQDKAMYELTKENIELMNIKYHDMKKMIGEMRRSHFDYRDESIEEMENLINSYNTYVSTGNDALDAILTQKCLLCDKNKIEMACMIDGEKMRFISPANLYSLFGNALQNAIEAVSAIKETEKRVIRLKINAVGNILFIHVENSIPDETVLVFENGLPKTTKDDKRQHGFGLKSIEMVVEKLHGGMKVTAEKKIFKLDIVIPIPEQIM